MKFAIGKELTAKIKVISKEVHEGKNNRESIGFDVLSIMTENKSKEQ